MEDLYHYFSGDVAPSGTGDVLLVDGPTKTQQRIIRRVLTNPGDYASHPDYGAGARRYIGATTASLNELEALIASQILQEEAVSPAPAPEVTAEQLGNSALLCTIRYADITGAVQVLTFDTEGNTI